MPSNPIDDVAIRSLFEKDAAKWSREDDAQFEALVTDLRESRRKYREAEETKKPRVKAPVAATYD